MSRHRSSSRVDIRNLPLESVQATAVLPSPGTIIRPETDNINQVVHDIRIVIVITSLMTGVLLIGYYFDQKTGWVINLANYLFEFGK